MLVASITLSSHHVLPSFHPPDIVKVLCWLHIIHFLWFGLFFYFITKLTAFFFLRKHIYKEPFCVLSGKQNNSLDMCCLFQLACWCFSSCSVSKQGNLLSLHVRILNHFCTWQPFHNSLPDHVYLWLLQNWVILLLKWIMLCCSLCLLSKILLKSYFFSYSSDVLW